MVEKAAAKLEPGNGVPGVQKTTWTRDAEATAYYYHRFYDFQPNLNMDNPGVRTDSFGYRWYHVGGLGYALRPQRDSEAGVKW